MDEFARHAAHKITLVVGSWQVFLLALLLIAGWALSGPIFGFSDTWQLVINTSTTIVTFLLGILILLEANRQAKESKVVHDELIRAVQGARNQLINIDEMSEADVDRLEADLRRRGERANASGGRRLRRGTPGTRLSDRRTAVRRRRGPRGARRSGWSGRRRGRRVCPRRRPGRRRGRPRARCRSPSRRGRRCRGCAR